MEAASKEEKRKAYNKAYYLKNKANIAKGRRVYYLQVEKRDSAKKEFMKLIKEVTLPL
jgi:aminopeptidase C